MYSPRQYLIQWLLSRQIYATESFDIQLKIGLLYLPVKQELSPVSFCHSQLYALRQYLDGWYLVKVTHHQIDLLRS